MQFVSVPDLESKLGTGITSRLETFYRSDLSLIWPESKGLLQDCPEISLWHAIAIEKSGELSPRKYRKFVDNRTKRCSAFFVAEFLSYESTSGGITDVYYGTVVIFVEHMITLPSTGRIEWRLLVIADWSSRGLKVGKEHPVFALVSWSSEALFPTRTVEDASCICRNISAIEVGGSKDSSESVRTYLVAKVAELDCLLTTPGGSTTGGKRLRGMPG